MATYREIFDLVEKAVFDKQCRNGREVATYIQAVRPDMGRMNINEIDKIIHKVATQYKS